MVIEAPDELWNDFVQRLLSAEPEAWKQLWDNYGEHLKSVVKRNTHMDLRGRIDPTSVLVSVFKTLWKRRTTWKGGMTANELWALIVVIALNKVRRRAGRLTRVQLLTNEQELGTNDAGRAAQAGQISAEVKVLLESLSEEERHIAGLLLEGHTQVEISEQFGRSERWVRGKIAAMRKRIQLQDQTNE